MPGASDDLIFNVDGMSSANVTANMAANNREYNSMTFRSSGTTQINRGTTDGTGESFLRINTGITLDAGAGAATFGTTGATAQLVRMRANQSTVSLTNNSDSLLTFNRTWQSEVTNTTTIITVDGAGSGGTEFVGTIDDRDTGRVIALTVNTAGTGLTTLFGANTYSGGTTLEQGTIALRNSNALGSGTLTINGGTLASAVVARTLTNNITVGGDFSLGGLDQPTTLNGTMNLGGEIRQITLANSATIGGVISNGGLSLDIGTGRTLTLNGANTYSGDTSITSGTLVVGGTGSLGATNVTVDTGAFLTVNAGGSIGDSPSILVNGTLNNADTLTIGNGNAIGGNGTIQGSLFFATGANLLFDPNNTLTVNGADVSFGGFDLTNLIGIDFGSLQLGTPYTLIAGSASIDYDNIGNFGFENRAPVGGGLEAYFQAGSLQLVVVPEPGTWALLALVFGATLVVVRRKKSQPGGAGSKALR